MAKHNFAFPTPRQSMLDPALFRPQWTVSANRDPRLLWLDKNENTDPAFIGLATRILSEIPPTAVSAYPDCAPLYHKLAKHVGVTPDCLLLTAGADGVIRSVFETFLREGDLVVHTEPTFAMYPVYCRMFGARTAALDYAPSDQGPYLSSKAVIDTIRRLRPRLLCLPNPDSPTGTVFPPAELRAIVDAAAETETLVLIDEAYHPYYDQSAVSWIGDCPNLVIARTCAKAWGLAGLRIGYAVACPEVAKFLHKTRPMYEVNTVAVFVLEKLLDHGEEMLASVERLNAGKDAFLAAMNKLGLRTIRANGNFCHVAFGKAAPAVHAALANMVLYRQDHDVPCLAGFSRFSATTVAQYQPIIETIRRAMGGGAA